MHHKYEVAAPISLTAGIGAWVPIFNEVVQVVAAIIGVISGIIYLYKTWRDSKRVRAS